jgi:zinc transport system substrate-binding protein
VGIIADTLATIDPQNAQIYEQNCAAYQEQLDILDKEIQTIVSGGKRNFLVFGDRFPFRYFTDDYNLECKAAYPGCSTATQASAKTVAALVEVVKDENVPVVLYRELSDHRIADTIARETGVQALELQSGHNISKTDFDSGATYLSMMRKNADVLKIALG